MGDSISNTDCVSEDMCVSASTGNSDERQHVQCSEAHVCLSLSEDMYVSASTDTQLCYLAMADSCTDPFTIADIKDGAFSTERQ